MLLPGGEAGGLRNWIRLRRRFRLGSRIGLRNRIRLRGRNWLGTFQQGSSAGSSACPEVVWLCSGRSVWRWLRLLWLLRLLGLLVNVLLQVSIIGNCICSRRHCQEQSDSQSNAAYNFYQIIVQNLHLQLFIRLLYITSEIWTTFLRAV